MDAEVDLSWDTSGGPHNGRLYLLYNDAPSTSSNDLDVYLRDSDNNGSTWSNRIRVNHDATTTSQFLPRMAIDETTGYLAFSWYDCRDDTANNTLAEYWATASFDGGATFLPDIKLSAGQSTAVGGNGNDYGDYSDIDFVAGKFIAAWSDDSNSTGDNPDYPGNTTGMEAYIAKVVVANNVPNYLISTTAGTTYANENFAIQGPPLAVSDLTVNNGDAQRSRLTTIRVTFANPVTIDQFSAVGAITLTRTTATALGTVGTIVQTGATGANGLISVTQLGPTNTIDLTFSNADLSAVTPGVESGSLADGRWQLAIPSASFVSTLNDPALRRLFGDSNNDGTVDGTDFGDFGTAFGLTVANSPFDFNADGTVDGTDFAEFGNRFGVTL